MHKKPLPCPFCGGQKSHITTYDGDVWRTCRDCRASTGAFRCSRDATKAWQMRSTNKRLDCSTPLGFLKTI
jgi:hypothetical protein